jgi:G3E family GTPase
MGDPALRRLVTLDAVITTVDASAWSVRLKLRGPDDRAVDEQLALVDRLEQLSLGQIGCSAAGIHTLVLALPGHLDADRVE